MTATPKPLDAARMRVGSPMPGHGQPGGDGAATALAGNGAQWRRRLLGRVVRRDEQGVATAFVLLLAVAFLAVAGVVIDAGAALAGKREAMNVAEQAAREGADALDQAALRSGDLHVDPTAATTAAQAYLRAAGVRGTVTVNGGVVRVEVTKHNPTKILSAIGVSDLPVTAAASAESIDQSNR